MKYGMRKPSLSKSISSRTTGKMTRAVKKSVSPLYGKKGMGVIKNPEKALKNRVYHKTTFGISDIANSSGKSSSRSNNVGSGYSKRTSMKLVDLKCPNCGAKLQVNSELKKATCNYCGQDFAIDDEVQHIQYDNAEQAGYEFEKGRQRAMEEHRASMADTQGESDSVESQTDTRPNGACSGTCWRIFLWIFLFPIMFTIWCWKTDKINNKAVKAILIAVVWVICIAGGMDSQRKDKSATQTEESIEEAAATENTAAVSTETLDENSSAEDDELLYDNEDENINALLLRFNDVSDTKITKDMVDVYNTNHSNGEVDFDDATLGIRFTRVTPVEDRTYILDLTQKDGNAEDLRPYYVALFRAMYSEADVDVLNQVYDQMIAMDYDYDDDIHIYGYLCESHQYNDESFEFTVFYDPSTVDRTTTTFDE